MATSCTSVSTSDTLTLHLDGPSSGAENMRRDTEFLQRCARGDIAGAVRVYWFAPACLSLGRLQPATDVDMAACARDGVDVVRRPSGGRAVLHDGEVTYAVVCRVTDPDLGGGVLDACARIPLGEGAVQVCTAELGSALSEAEAQDTRALFIPGDGVPQLPDFARMTSLHARS